MKLMNDTSSQLEPPNPPRVIKWFNVYCWVGCFWHIGVVMFSLLFFRAPLDDLAMSETDAIIMGVVILVTGLVAFAAFALPLIVAPRPWVWIYGIVLICMGMTSACFLPACIPLLIHWIKPEAKRYFGST